MIRGIIAGGLWGAVIGAVVVALTSQLTEWRDLSPAVTAEETETEIVPDRRVAAVETAPSVVSGGERAPQVAVATPKVESAAADQISAPMLDTLPPSAPSAGTARDGMTAEIETAEAPSAPAAETGRAPEPSAVAVATVPEVDAAPEPGKPALSPATSAPAAQENVAALTAPAPDAPETVPGAGGESVVIAGTPGQAAEISPADPNPEAQQAPQPVAAAPEAEPEPQGQIVEILEPPKPPSEEPGTVEVAEVPAPPQPAGEDVAESSDSDSDAEVAPVGAEVANGGKTSEDAPQVRQLAGGGSSLPGQRVTGLPRIGADGTEETDQAAAPEPEQDDPSELSALDRNRVAFEAPEGAGLIAVVLVQGAGGVLDLPELPVTLAVPAGLPTAAELAETYHAAGHEVVLIPDLPPRARAQDVEVSLPVNLEAIPDAVAVMDAGDNGFQADRGATASVVAAVSESGHGLLTWPKGFNTAQKLADQEGVPASLVYGRIEAGDPGAIARELDRAAFRARQEGGIVIVGPADPTVVDALRSWLGETRRTDVVIAPLSAVLTGG